MEGLINASPTFKETPINQVFMLGTHDSGTYGSGDYIRDSYARTQSKDITGQLEAGIRYFDFRPYATGDQYKICHGGWISKHRLGIKNEDPERADNAEIFKQIRDFLKTHSKEIVILKFQSFTNFDKNDYGDFVTLIESFFTVNNKCMLVIPQSGNYRDQINGLKIKDLTQQRVIVMFDDKDVPSSSSFIWTKVFRFKPKSVDQSTGKLALPTDNKYVLWDPYWDDEDSGLADDNKPLHDWWGWHSRNIGNWNRNGLFVLQSHMQSLPGDVSHPFHGYFNLSELVAAKNYYMNVDSNQKVLENNARNMEHYVNWFLQGNHAFIVTFDYIEYGHLMAKLIQAYKTKLAIP